MTDKQTSEFLTLRTGNVVKGNKHSYKMTVEESNENTTDCVYFDKDQNVHKVVYNTNELEFISH